MGRQSPESDSEEFIKGFSRASRVIHSHPALALLGYID
jgi:hypothetical protein